MIYWLLAILVVLSYFLGNINFGKIIAKFKKVDLTKKGSGNLGATNTYRNMGAKFGYLVLLLDALKGVVAALTGYLAFGGTSGFPDSTIGLYACGLAAIVGHIFPVIYKFKGGKGMSATLGVFLVSQPIVVLVAFVLGFWLVWFVKYVSLASLILVSIFVIWQNVTMQEPNLAVSILTFCIFALVWFAHRANIERLLIGKENETNIQAKIRKDKKKQAKLEQKQFEREWKVVYRINRKELKNKMNVYKVNKKVLKNQKFKKGKHIKKEA